MCSLPAIKLSKSDVCTITKVCQVLGWVCLLCKSKLKALLSLDVASLPSNLESRSGASINPRSLQSVDPCNPPSISSSSGAKAAASDQSEAEWTKVSRKITREVRDTLNRRKNVIISGLSLSLQGNANDKAVVTELCKKHLNHAPNVTFTKRLGKAPTSAPYQPQRLFVGLLSEDEATHLIQHAKQLRSSKDPLIATSVYINAHLSPEESKEANERRQRQRAGRAQKALSLNPSASSFVSRGPQPSMGNLLPIPPPSSSLFLNNFF